MAVTNELITHLDFQALLDGMGQGILIFDQEDNLILDNLAARRLLGNNMARIRRKGWRFCATLLDAEKAPDAPETDAIRAQAIKETQPIHFQTALDGVFLPGWLSAIYLQTGEVLTQLCLDVTDWSALTELMNIFRSEARQAITATRGHTELITQMAQNRTKSMTADQLAGRVMGFSELVTSHMHRLEMLIDLLYRWEIILTGKLPEDINKHIQRLELADWLEDYLEGLVEHSRVDPDIGLIDYRDRLTINVADGLYVSASPYHLGTIIRDLLRNAVLYTPDDSPIILQAVPLSNSPYVRIDIIDRGCGIRDKERDKVFAPFQRAMQPQVISQFGYGLSLFLSRMELEAMRGSITFNSEEGVGSVFSVMLRAWDADHDAEAEG